MANIELSTAPVETVVDTANDHFFMIDVSETPDAINRVTGASLLGQNLLDIKGLADPNADRLLFWDDSAGAYTHLTLGTNLSITGTTINASGGGGLSGLGSTDNAILRADGVGGATAQGSLVIIDDSGFIGFKGSSSYTTVPNLYSVDDTDSGWAMHPTAGVCSWVKDGAARFGIDGVTGFTMGNAFQVAWNSAVGAFGAGQDAGLVRGGAAATVRVTDGSTGGGALQFTEMTAPAAPAANNGVLYMVDNGSGKTQLCVRFATGAAIVLATEA